MKRLSDWLGAEHLNSFSSAMSISAFNKVVFTPPDTCISFISSDLFGAVTRESPYWDVFTLIAFALFEAFKADVADPVVAVTAYPTTLRRSLLDVA
nr:hypothetical protein [bacterium]